MKFISFCLFILLAVQVKSQCITVFPYHEDFEASTGNWISGGTNNDWAWGTPAKPVINTAGSGTKCWIVGGLSGLTYMSGERSWVQSPCFDFTALQHPWIKFKYFWESEHHYDGGNLQYSINSGATWINVGAFGDPVDCLNANWYNFTPINYLTTLATVHDGWSGNTQVTSGACQGGFGSNGWVTAMHCMTYLAGQPNVIFRFTFGAGTTCNTYDGNAFDDIYIQDAPPVVPDFSDACLGNNNISFTDLSTQCPDTWHWNFGDINSGAADSSSLQNPNHTFTAAGVYTVTLNAGSTCTGMFTIAHTVTILSVTAASPSAICNGVNNGIAIATASGLGAGNYNYNWSTVPVQTNDTAFNLGAGNYTVTVSAANACPASATVTLSQTTINLGSQIAQPNCAGLTGSIIIQPTGGAIPYTYQWTPNVSATATAANLVNGTYSVIVTDNTGCTTYDTVSIASPAPIVINLTTTEDSCNRNTGAIASNVSGGIAPYQYLWTPGNATTTSLTNLAGNNSYTLNITDNNGCQNSAVAAIQITGAVSVYLGNDTSICNGQTLLLSTAGIYSGYTWQDGSHASGYSVSESGTYWLQVTDNNGCTGADTINVTTCFTGIAVPNAFSPNGDGANDIFKPIIRESVDGYSMHIFNRWGQLIYENELAQYGWDGTYQGQNCEIGTYVYFIQFTGKNGKQLMKGNVTLIR